MDHSAFDNSDREKLSEGDFMRLFLKNEPALRAFARSILPDWNSVDDALQEASVTMWEKLGQLRDEAGFLPWAKVILRFKCLAVIGRLRRNRFVLSDSVLELIADETEPMSQGDYFEIRSALEKCLGEFSRLNQELLLAPYSGEGQVKQIAQLRNKTANSLYKLLGRLREKLAICIRGQLAAEVN